MRRDTPLRLALCTFVLGGAYFICRPFVSTDESQLLIRNAAIALSREEWSTAKQLCEKAVASKPDSAYATTILGIATARTQDKSESLEYLDDVADSEIPAALNELGLRMRQVGRLAEAEENFQAALSVDPRNVFTHRQLSELLSFEGRCSEAGPHLLAQVQAGRFRAGELCLLGIPDRIVRKDDHLHKKSESSGSVLQALGNARILVADHKYNEAEPAVRRIVKEHPEIALAQALLGKIYLLSDRDAKFLSWHDQLPESVTASAEIWHVRSMWAKKTDQIEGATRCLLEMLKTQSGHVEANYQLSQLFQKLRQQKYAQYFSDRSLLLSRLGYVINDLQNDPNEHLMQEAVDSLEKLGRCWEAIAWCQLAKEWTPNDWCSVSFERLRKKVIRHPQQILPGYHPLEQIDPQQYTFPRWEALENANAQAQTSDTESIRFTNDAQRTGLDFQYFNSMDPKIGLEHIFQTTGGGVAVLDYDLDLLPDLYFGNGRNIPEKIELLNSPQTVHRDVIYRNLGNKFDRVTDLTGLGDDRFSQGVTSGDIDNDGFPDLYVGNVGHNRLYRNNGDGTFTELPDAAGTQGSEWTMSAMIADVDADGASDIYLVNYLKLDEVFHRSCKKDGQPLTCAPTLFAAEQDRLYRNNGDGTFQDVTSDWGLEHRNGKGLGVVGLKVNGRKGLQIFVANDTTENLYFERSENSVPGYRENAILAGLAMSEAGNMQACMGVAAGDADNDGTVDLFVTNFFADSNTMYLQKTPGIFSDATRRWALDDPSYGMVGFGTQFLDANLDGRPDLIVTNGHVDQTFATGEPDRMPPQFFLNVNNERFTSLDDDSLGPAFREERFGRALARVDWNRDHKDDVCIVHLDSEVALLTNGTETRNKAIILRLTGRTCARDAIGTTITLETTERTLVRQLTGGDGYQTANEKRLCFGLLPDEEAVVMFIDWPDGSIQEFEPKALKGEIHIIQGMREYQTSLTR